MTNGTYQSQPVNTMHTITKFDNFWDSCNEVNEYGFLSNFHICPEPVSIDLPWTGTMTAITTEHLFAAAKTAIESQRRQILAAPSPGAAKHYGRVCDLIRDWQLVKMSVMRICIEAKFSLGSDLADQLINTFPLHLREGTTWGDCAWGVDVYEEGHPGQNMLGMLLMDHRSRLMDKLPPVGFIV
jgi:ribA/ribD-fused uncharacterized protein